MSRIAKFLEKPISDQVAKNIADMCSFDKMKSEKQKTNSYLPESIFTKGGTVYHSGNYVNTLFD